jgi:hypothetical protein
MARTALIATIAGVLFSTSALAQDGAGHKAMVEVQSDQIAVNRGSGYRQVRGITPLVPGQLVMASESGHGWIIYPDCDLEVLPGKVYTVQDRPGVVEIGDAKEGRPLCKIAAFPLWLLAAPAIGVGLCAVSGCFDDDDPRRPAASRPASP